MSINTAGRCDACGAYVGMFVTNHMCAITSPPVTILPTYLQRIAPEGWQCPKCERVWSPNVVGCEWCNTRIVGGEGGQNG